MESSPAIQDYRKPVSTLSLFTVEQTYKYINFKRAKSTVLEGSHRRITFKLSRDAKRDIVRKIIRNYIKNWIGSENKESLSRMMSSVSVMRGK